jgi:hypothetical protein
VTIAAVFPDGLYARDLGCTSGIFCRPGISNARSSAFACAVGEPVISALTERACARAAALIGQSRFQETFRQGTHSRQ